MRSALLSLLSCWAIVAGLAAGASWINADHPPCQRALWVPSGTIWQGSYSPDQENPEYNSGINVVYLAVGNSDGSAHLVFLVFRYFDSENTSYEKLWEKCGIWV